MREWSLDCRQIRSDFDIPRVSSQCVWWHLFNLSSLNSTWCGVLWVEDAFEIQFLYICQSFVLPLPSTQSSSIIHNRRQASLWTSESTKQISHSKKNKNKLKYFSLKCDWQCILITYEIRWINIIKTERRELRRKSGSNSSCKWRDDSQRFFCLKCLPEIVIINQWQQKGEDSF